MARIDSRQDEILERIEIYIRLFFFVCLIAFLYSQGGLTTETALALVAGALFPSTPLIRKPIQKSLMTPPETEPRDAPPTKQE